MGVLPRRRRRLDARHEPVLGTVLSLHLAGRSARSLRQAERLLLSEIGRLEAIFSIHDPTSELSRWKAAPGDGPVGSELALLLRLGLDWQAATGGLFNPAAGLLVARWRQAATLDEVPPEEELAALAASIARPRYALGPDGPIKDGDCRPLDFNALAKGLVVDLASAAVLEAFRLDSLVVNIGGDLVHRGGGGALVAVEDPARPYDNAAPIASLTVRNAGMATSGSARRGAHIGGRWFSHVIDPRSGWPADEVASATVVAADAATADVLATPLSILQPAEGLALVARLAPRADEPACLVAGADGTTHRNSAWDHVAG